MAEMAEKDDKQKTTISFRPEVLRKLRLLAALRDTTMSDIVEKLVEERLVQEEKRLDEIEKIMKE